MDLRTLLACAATLGCVERVGVGDAAGETSGDSDVVDESGSTGSSSDSGTESDAEAESDSADSDSDPTSTSFICSCDAARGLVECDPFLQDCSEGEKCVPFDGPNDEWLGHGCVPVTGDQAAGEACEWHESHDNCDATTMCWNFVPSDDGQVGTCVPFCTGTPDVPVCPRGMTCMISRDIPVWCE